MKVRIFGVTSSEIDKVAEEEEFDLERRREFNVVLRETNERCGPSLERANVLDGAT